MKPSGVRQGLAGPREWLGLAVLALPCLVMVMDFTVLNLAVSTLTQDLRPTSTELLWIVDVYGFFVAGLLIVMGNLGDRIGRRRLLMIGGAAFGAASVFAALSTSPTMLIAARLLLGVAGATLAPSTLSLIRVMFHDDKQQARAISIWASSFAAGGVAGPLIGGLMLRYFWWGSVFLISVPVMLLLVIVGPRVLPEFRDRSQGRIDVISAGLCLAAVLSLVYGLKQIAQDGLTGGLLIFLLVGTVLALRFVRRQTKLAHPLIDVALFRTPAFARTLMIFAMSGFVMFGASFYVAQYLQLVLDLSPLQAGLCLAPATAAVIAGAQLAPALARRYDATSVMLVGMLVTAAGFVLLALTGEGGVPALVASYFVMSVGVGPVTSLCPGLIISAAPPERAGAAASISSTSAEFGGALGLAVLGSIGLAVYREGMPTDLVASESARRSLAAALQEAGQLPEGAREAVATAARSSFNVAFDVVAIVSAALIAVMVVAMALGTLGRRRHDAVAEGHPSGTTRSAGGDDRMAEALDPHVHGPLVHSASEVSEPPQRGRRQGSQGVPTEGLDTDGRHTPSVPRSQRLRPDRSKGTSDAPHGGPPR